MDLLVIDWPSRLLLASIRMAEFGQFFWGGTGASKSQGHPKKRVDVVEGMALETLRKFGNPHVLCRCKIMQILWDQCSFNVADGVA